jgi:threonine/homoserine/homoserine lactone efflux protein
MTMQEFAALLTLAAAMSFTPGPNTALSTAIAANHGLRAALPFVGAVPVGWSLLLLASGLGVAQAVLRWPALRGAILLGGTGYLVWLAWRLARTHRLAAHARPPDPPGFWAGVGLQFVNGKAWMLALTVASGWMVPTALAGEVDGAAAAGLSPTRAAQVIATMAVFAFASNFTYASIGAALRAWLAQGRRLVLFNRGMALLLVATAAWMWRG